MFVHRMPARLAAACVACASLAACWLTASVTGLRAGSSEPDAGADAPGDVAVDAPRDAAADAMCQPGCRASGAHDSCASVLVPGGTFDRDYDGVDHKDPSHPSFVSDFRLDAYEITVGRFRRFVDAYPANQPAAGSGKDPNDPLDPGWDIAWTSRLPPNGAALRAAVSCDPSHQTWTDTPGDNETKPMNCVTWLEAFAFCIADGGRLPTMAEWNYAAAGGSEQRVYPWSSPPNSNGVDGDYAVYAHPAGPLAAGSRSTKGDGRWGHADLAGNVNEWLIDWTSPTAYVDPCSDCAQFTYDASSNKLWRGGAYDDTDTSNLHASGNQGSDIASRQAGVGARCARPAR